jgi:hypothetical protein
MQTISMRPERLSCRLAKQEREKKVALLQQRPRIRLSAQCSFVCALLSIAPRTKQMKVTTKTLRRAMGSAALATTLATAARAQSPSWPTPPAVQAERHAAPQAESPTAPQAKPTSPLSPARLGQMLAPIALYPDDLLADVLAAATYPLDVVEAARWLQDPQNAALKGDQLFAALQQKSWDQSVKSLALFPRILRMLDANLEWSEQLGEAYLADPAALMDAVQRLRLGLNLPAGWSQRCKRSCARNRSLRVSKSRLRSRLRVQRSSTSRFAILHSPTVLGPTPIFRRFPLSSRVPISAGAVGSAGRSSCRSY